jgi:predicted Zn-dependent peptidase
VFDGYEDDGVVDVAAGVQHKRAARVTGEILAMFEELAREGPTDDELATARRRIQWDARQMADSAEETGGFFAGGLLFDRFATAQQHVDELLGVGPDDVRAAARELAQPERLNVVAVGLLEDGEDRRLEDVVKGWAGAGARG